MGVYSEQIWFGRQIMCKPILLGDKTFCEKKCWLFPQSNDLSFTIHVLSLSLSKFYFRGFSWKRSSTNNHKKNCSHGTYLLLPKFDLMLHAYGWHIYRNKQTNQTEQYTVAKLWIPQCMAFKLISLELMCF